MKKMLTILGVVAVLGFGTAYAIGQDATAEDLIGACPPGSHFKVTVTHPDGGTDSLTIERDLRELPPGSTISSNGITVNQDGTVEAKNGEVECIEP